MKRNKTRILLYKLCCPTCEHAQKRKRPLWLSFGFLPRVMQFHVLPLTLPLALALLLALLLPDLRRRLRCLRARFTKRGNGGHDQRSFQLPIRPLHEAYVLPTRLRMVGRVISCSGGSVCVCVCACLRVCVCVCARVYVSEEGGGGLLKWFSLRFFIAFCVAPPFL
jgi:hypothetical protein